jgi:hypothetical protein
MFTKPEGVFLQLLGPVALIGGIVMLVSGVAIVPGVVVVFVGVGLFWLGRQTHPRKNPGGNH